MKEADRDQPVEPVEPSAQDVARRISVLICGIVFMLLGLTLAINESGRFSPLVVYRRILLAAAAAFMFSLVLSRKGLPSWWSIKFGLGDLLIFSGHFFVQIALQQVVSGF